MPDKQIAPVNTSGFWEFLVIVFVLLGFITLSSQASRNLAAARLPQLTSTSNIPETGPVIVNIANKDPKVEKAIVHILGTDQMDDLDQNVLSLPLCSKGQFISVWAPGYYILTFPCVDNPTGRYDVRLEPVNSSDDTDYQWTDAGLISDPSPKCASCHAGSLPHLNKYPEWEKDGHSRVFKDPSFWTTYQGTNINRQQSQQIQWTILADGQKIYPLLDPMKPNYGAGYRLDYPVSNGNCAFCHVPASSPGTLQDMDVSALIDNYLGGHVSAATEGVTCDVCHKVTDVLVGKDQLPYDDRPGILSMSIVRPISDQHFTYGPLAFQSSLNSDLDPNSDAKRTCFPVFGESKFCAACHYAKFANTLIYGSYKEWLDSPYSNPQNSNYRSCQDCHMLDETQIQNTLPSERSACSETNVKFNFSHNMMKYGSDPKNPSREIPLLVQNAAQVTLQPTTTGGQIRITVTVLNTGAGHKFPTDSPLRHLILLVEAKDWRGNKLVQSGGPMVPVWAAPDLAGYAGQIYANLFKDKDTNLVPSFAYWNPVETAWPGADTRLVPGVPVPSEYAFAAPYDRLVTITARLIYRRAFINVIGQKGWPLIDEDVEVTETALECTGFDISPENMRCEPVSPNP